MLSSKSHDSLTVYLHQACTVQYAGPTTVGMVTCDTVASNERSAIRAMVQMVLNGCELAAHRLVLVMVL